MSFAPAYTYINASELAAQLKDPQTRARVAIVDARDDDFVGGHIAGAVNVPAVKLAAGDAEADQTAAELVGKLRCKQKVVFHCHLSQARGPKAARIYSEARTAFSARDGESTRTSQEIFVLRDGFAVFGPKYKVCSLMSA